MEALEAAFNEDESPWTRQSAVPRLSAVIQVLSLLSSPLEGDEYYSVIRTLEVIHDRLWAPDCSVSPIQAVYTPLITDHFDLSSSQTNSEAIRHIGKSMGVLSPIHGQAPFPFALDQRIKASKVLLDAILLLSTSSSSTPLPRLPLDILYLILPHVATDPDFPTRRKTLHSLISTSTQWRKIALPTWHSQVILYSGEDVSMWCDSNHYTTLESASLDLLHIDLSTAESADIEALMRSPMRDGLKERGIKIKHITLNMEVDEDEMSSTEDRDLCRACYFKMPFFFFLNFAMTTFVLLSVYPAASRRLRQVKSSGRASSAQREMKRE